RQLGCVSGADELYWDVSGNGWTFPFDRLSAEVGLPAPVPAGALRLAAYTGPQGSRGSSYEVFAREGGAAFRATRAFAPREGMTIVVDRKSTRLNSSHEWISYAVFCLKKKQQRLQDNKG